MSKFVSRIEATSLGCLAGVKKDIGCRAIPKREGVDFATVLHQRKNTDAMGFEEMNHVTNRALPNTPSRPEANRSSFRVAPFVKVRNCANRQCEALLDPAAKPHGQRSTSKRGLSLAGCHSAKRSEAGAIATQFINIVATEELRRE